MGNDVVSAAQFVLFGPKGLDHLEFAIPYPASVIYSHIARYLFAAQTCRGKVCLDVACGCGYGSYLLKLAGAAQVVGGDIQCNPLQRAIHNFSEPGLAFVCSDAMMMPFCDDSFDIVSSFETIEHLSRPDDFLRQVIRVLKPGGILMCSTPNRIASSAHGKNPYNPFHVKEYTPGEFGGLLSRYFERVLLFGQDRIGVGDVRLGKGAHFLKAVGSKCQLFDRLLTVVGVVSRGEFSFVRLEEAMEGVIDGKLRGAIPYGVYELGGVDRHHPLSLVALGLKHRN